jgi:hypothetical protein
VLPGGQDQQPGPTLDDLNPWVFGWDDQNRCAWRRREKAEAHEPRDWAEAHYASGDGPQGQPLAFFVDGTSWSIPDISNATWLQWQRSAKRGAQPVAGTVAKLDKKAKVAQEPPAAQPGPKLGAKAAAAAAAAAGQALAAPAAGQALAAPAAGQALAAPGAPQPTAAAVPETERRREPYFVGQTFQGKIQVKYRADRTPLISIYLEKRQLCQATISWFASEAAAAAAMVSIATKICDGSLSLDDVQAARDDVRAAAAAAAPKAAPAPRKRPAASATEEPPAARRAGPPGSAASSSAPPTPASGERPAGGEPLPPVPLSLMELMDAASPVDLEQELLELELEILDEA